MKISNLLKTLGLIFVVATSACKKDSNGDGIGAFPAPAPVNAAAESPGTAISLNAADDQATRHAAALDAQGRDQALQGTQLASDAGGGGADSAAAMAEGFGVGSLGVNSKKSNSSNSSSSNGSLNGTPLFGSSNGSGGANFGGLGAGGAGAGISSLGNVSTAPITDPSLINGQRSVSADSLGAGASGAGGAYALGAGSGLGIGNGAGDGSSGDVGGGAHGHSIVDIERDPASNANDSVSGPIGSQDPDNYFAMLNPQDNLFKVVERRYIKKSQQWSLADVAAVQGSVQGSVQQIRK